MESSTGKLCHSMHSVILSKQRKTGKANTNVTNLAFKLLIVLSFPVFTSKLPSCYLFPKLTNTVERNQLILYCFEAIYLWTSVNKSNNTPVVIKQAKYGYYCNGEKG